MESLLIGVLNSQDVSSQMDYMRENYADDVRTAYLFSQLEILKVLIKDAQINCFADVLKAVKSLTDHERHMITEVIVICKFLLVNPASSATGERPFSMARRVKMRLRANMKQQRFNNVALLQPGAVASWLARSTPERVLRVRALAGDIVLCSWARHFTLTVPLSTQVYKWVPANLMLGVTLRWTSIPSRGE